MRLERTRVGTRIFYFFEFTTMLSVSVIWQGNPQSKEIDLPYSHFLSQFTAKATLFFSPHFQSVSLPLSIRKNGAIRILSCFPADDDTIAVLQMWFRSSITLCFIWVSIFPFLKPKEMSSDLLRLWLLDFWIKLPLPCRLNISTHIFDEHLHFFPDST